MTDEHKEDDSIKGELREVTREFRHVFERRTSTGSGHFFSILDNGFAQLFGQIVSMIVKTLRNTNFAASSCFNPLSPNSDQQQFSPNDINTLS